MHRVKRMTSSPMSCLVCGRGNTPDDPDTMDDLWFLDTERDIDWGDTAYICKYCCEKIGIFADLVGVQELKETQDTVRRQAKKIHDLESKLAARQRRIDAITGGQRAVRRVSKERGDVVAELKKRTKQKAAKGDD